MIAVGEKTGKLFKITQQELTFLRKLGLPIPHRTPLQRHFDRTLPYAFWNLFDRTCGKCNKTIQTTYAPDRPEKVYCEECYLAAVY